MILPQLKILTLFAAVAMIPVLALPVPYDSLNSYNPPLALAIDIHSHQASPQVVGKEISMSKRMDPGDERVVSPLTPSTVPEVIPFPSFKDLHPLLFEPKKDSGSNYEVPLLLDERSNVLYRLKKKGEEKGTYNCFSHHYCRGRRIDGLLTRAMDHAAPGYEHVLPDQAMKVLNAYYILAIAKDQVAARIQDIKAHLAHLKGPSPDYDELFRRIQRDAPRPSDMIKLYLADRDGIFSSYLYSDAYEAVRVPVEENRLVLERWFGKSGVMSDDLAPGPSKGS
ncbi:hypothetical protein EV361DRAFT_871797 [Lentinula raphanica]|nr:hypothetical protein EV361DRAFT_871797 [Lentinula raphanica]